MLLTVYLLNREESMKFYLKSSVSPLLCTGPQQSHLLTYMIANEKS
jgi:hypothetical protein